MNKILAPEDTNKDDVIKDLKQRGQELEEAGIVNLPTLTDQETTDAFTTAERLLGSITECEDYYEAIKTYDEIVRNGIEATDQAQAQYEIAKVYELWYACTLKKTAEQFGPKESESTIEAEPDSASQDQLRSLPGGSAEDEQPSVATAIRICDRYDSLIQTAVDRYPGIEAGMIKAIMYVESRCNPAVHGTPDEIGLMQLIKQWSIKDVQTPELPSYKYCTSVANPIPEDVLTSGDYENNRINIEIGTCYFAQLLHTLETLDKAIVAYNVGPDEKPQADAQAYLTQVKNAIPQVMGSSLPRIPSSEPSTTPSEEITTSFGVFVRDGSNEIELTTGTGIDLAPTTPLIVKFSTNSPSICKMNADVQIQHCRGIYDFACFTLETKEKLMKKETNSCKIIYETTLGNIKEKNDSIFEIKKLKFFIRNSETKEAISEPIIIDIDTPT